MLTFRLSLLSFFACVRACVLQRTFDASGKNSYKLLDENDKCVSTKKKDLEEMLDRLNVQVENPVCIMDQENSKEFIKGNEKDKYRFFKKATDLERVVTGIQESKTDLESMKGTFDASYKKLRGVAEDAEKVTSDCPPLPPAHSRRRERACTPKESLRTAALVYLSRGASCWSCSSSSFFHSLCFVFL
jgi:hypothetical protein